jgi:hypothetical protein
MTSGQPTLLICALLMGCSGSSNESPKADSRAPSVGKLSSVASPNGIDSAMRPASPCPRTGRWALCSVEQRLKQSGFVVRRIVVEPPGRAGFSVAPAVYALGGMRLEVFIYPNEAALARDVAKLDTVNAVPRGSASRWQTETAVTFVRSGNLAAVFLSDNALQVERLTLALTAGAPQP